MSPPCQPLIRAAKPTLLLPNSVQREAGPTPTPRTLEVSVSFCLVYFYLRKRDSKYCCTVSYFFILRLGKGWVSIPVSCCNNNLSSHFISPGEAAGIDKCVLKARFLKPMLLESRAHRPKRQEQWQQCKHSSTVPLRLSSKSATTQIFFNAPF